MRETESVGWGRLALLLGVIAFAAIGFLGSIRGESTAVAQTGPSTTCDSAYGCPPGSSSTTSGSSTTTGGSSTTTGGSSTTTGGSSTTTGGSSTTTGGSSTTTACPPAAEFTLSLSDDTLAEGQTVTLTSSGAEPGAEVVFRFDGTIIGRAFAGADRVASVQWTVPNGTSNGEHTFSAETRICAGVVIDAERDAQVLGDAAGGGAVAGDDARRGNGAVAGGNLARTGANILGLILLAIVLLLLGRTLQLEAKRRRAREAAISTL